MVSGVGRYRSGCPLVRRAADQALAQVAGNLLRGDGLRIVGCSTRLIGLEVGAAGIICLRWAGHDVVWLPYWKAGSG